MAQNRENRRIAREALTGFLNALPMKLLPTLETIAHALVKDALLNRGFMSFTGNTITSYTVGIYLNGTLNTIVSSFDELKHPVHIKIRKGQFVYLESPYEGEPRVRRGAVEVDNKGWGIDTALEFLRNFKISKRIPVAMVMTTGTEYSFWIEQNNLNVLAITAENARQIFLSNIQSANV